MSDATAAALAVVVAGAPLAVGAVHRPTVLVMLALVLATMALMTYGQLRSRAPLLRVSRAALFPAVFVVLTALQLVPLPSGLVDRLDPAGAALLADGGGGHAGTWRPLTLDRPATIQALGRGAAALLVFLLAYHLASGRSHRSALLLRALALAGVAAVTIGVGHRVFSIEQVYGLFRTGRSTGSVLVGPFINPNHTAELLELAAFVAIACARQEVLPLRRAAWVAAAAVSAAGALATLSRSSVFALGIGFVFLRVADRWSANRTPERAPSRKGLVATAAVLLGLLAIAGSIGAGQILDRFRENSFGQDLRLGLWRDSLNVFSAHPLGIGRGAFDVVYPAYRSLEVGRPVRFSWVENEPLQLLIDFGWLVPLVGAAALLPLREIVGGDRRRDGAQIALVAALMAVAAHSATDFGLETLGVLLPFVAVLGIVIGRNNRGKVANGSRSVPAPAPAPAQGAALVVGGALATLAALAGVASPSGKDFDAALARASTPAARRDTLVAARAAHPVDYFFALSLAQLEPLAPPSPDQRSPRLRTLNQALWLCRNCPDVHREVARTLWALGRRSQALSEWSAASKGQPAMFQQALDELSRQKATPTELAQVAGADPVRLVQVAEYALRGYPPRQVEPVIAAAAEVRAAPLEVALLRARLELMAHDPVASRRALARAKQLASLDGRVVGLEADLLVADGTPAAGAAALRLVETALEAAPRDLDLQRQRLAILTRFERWSAADRAIAGFKQALTDVGASSVEGNLAAAGIYLQLSRVRDAVTEYRIATTAQPTNVGLWRQFGAVAEGVGRLELAREAFTQAARLDPGARSTTDLTRIEAAQAAERNGPPSRLEAAPGLQGAGARRATIP